MDDITEAEIKQRIEEMFVAWSPGWRYTQDE